MEEPGDPFHCPHCDEAHTVKEDEEGFSATVEFRKLFVECPTYDGVIVWATVSE
ncbi:hypothetical protein [Natrarchaeobius halalkaliphilus]|uniref:hypothetical protein n=1 Tax=Natrarchaeobius halalkaliphilus TaxID=1679091 RepID=UPI001404CDBD|nr:hypothetical protein [Natrarchaeobius halalkaliphilus]